MEQYVGMDVSFKETSICVVDGGGKILREGTVISEPAAIAGFVKARAAGAVRIGLETGPITTWLWYELRALGLQVICIDARHAKAALSLQINKSDRNDAVGLLDRIGADLSRSSRRLTCGMPCMFGGTELLNGYCRGILGKAEETREPGGFFSILAREVRNEVRLARYQLLPVHGHAPVSSLLALS